MLKPLHQVGEWVRDRYQIHKLLGQGATGDTYQAEDLQQHHWVALKVISLQRLGDWDSLERFEREAKALEIIDHPGVPDYIEHFQQDTPDDKRFYLVQEFASGKSLAEWVEEGWRATEAEVQQIAVELLSILNYLHQLDPPMLHRDVKPQNIIRQSDGRLYLVDFGAVQSICQDSLRQRGTFVGTMGYMPPEQLRGQAQFASDLYALGATVVFLLTHRNPDELPMERMKIRFQGRVAISKPFADWLEKMLEPSLKKRFTSAKVAIATLKANNKPQAKPQAAPQRYLSSSNHQTEVSSSSDIVTHPNSKQYPIKIKQYNDGSLFYITRSYDSLKIESPDILKMTARNESSGSMGCFGCISILATALFIVTLTIMFRVEFSSAIFIFLAPPALLLFIIAIISTAVIFTTTEVGVQDGKIYYSSQLVGQRSKYSYLPIYQIEAIRKYGKRSDEGKHESLLISYSGGKADFLPLTTFSDWQITAIHDFISENLGTNIALNTFPNPRSQELYFHQHRIELWKNNDSLKLSIQPTSQSRNNRKILVSQCLECDSSQFSITAKSGSFGPQKLMRRPISHFIQVWFKEEERSEENIRYSYLHASLPGGEKYIIAEDLDFDEMRWISIAVNSFLQEVQLPSKNPDV